MVSRSQGNLRACSGVGSIESVGNTLKYGSPIGVYSTCVYSVFSAMTQRNDAKSKIQKPAVMFVRGMVGKQQQHRSAMQRRQVQRSRHLRHQISADDKPLVWNCMFGTSIFGSVVLAQKRSARGTCSASP